VLQTWVWCGLGCRRGCGSVVGGAASVGVSLLLVVLPAWVCGFDGGAVGVSVWV
jgi:hypothetical protein